MLRNLAIFSVAALICPLAVYAQVNLPAKVNPAEQAFLRHAAEINIADVDLAQLAQENSSAESVKQFAQRVINDHTNNEQKVKDLAARVDVVLPDQLSANQTDEYARLTKLSGPEFEHAYINDMIQGHEQAISQYENEAKTATNSAVRMYASETLPMLREHLKLAHQVAVEIGATSRR